MAETESLIKKITEASKQIKAISKDGKNNFQGYTFQSESAIKSAVKSAIESVGISIIPSFEILNQRDVKNNKGRVAHIVDVMGSFDITDGNEHITGTMPGSGLDNGEKATAKACTRIQTPLIVTWHSLIATISKTVAIPHDKLITINNNHDSLHDRLGDQ